MIQMDPTCVQKSPIRLTVYENPIKSLIYTMQVKSHCLKITQNVAFECFNFGIFRTIFVLLKVTCLVTLFDRKL